MKVSVSICYSSLTLESFSCWISIINRHLTLVHVTTRELFSVDRAWGGNVCSTSIIDPDKILYLTVTMIHGLSPGRTYHLVDINHHLSLFAFHLSVGDFILCSCEKFYSDLACLKITSNSDLIVSNVRVTVENSLESKWKGGGCGLIWVIVSKFGLFGKVTNLRACQPTIWGSFRSMG